VRLRRAAGANILACVSVDPDERDWRLTGELTAADGGRLNGLMARRREAHAAGDAADAVGPEVVVTHDGERLFAYAATRAAIEDARTKLEQAVSQDGLAVAFSLTVWSQDADEWLDPDAPAPSRPAAADEATVTHTYVVTLGRWVREEFEESLAQWAKELGVTYEVVEHPHLLSSQAAFTVTGPSRKVDEFAAAMSAEERATIRTETAVIGSPL
jgi:hypothetical protein